MNKECKKIVNKIRKLFIAMGLIVSLFVGQAVFAEEETESFATAENILEIDSEYDGDSITIEAEPVEEFEGTITASESSSDTSTCEFSYTAPRDGIYYFSLENVSSNFTVFCNVYDPLGNEICGLSSDLIPGRTAELEESETYIIQAYTYDASTNFTIHVYVPEASRDISEAADVIDQLSYSEQENIYFYSVPQNGKYAFLLTDTTPNVHYKMTITNQYGMQITYESGNTFSTSVELEENETYEIHLSTVYSDEFGKYTLNIIKPKPTSDITGYTEILDIIEYEEQTNIYSFKVPVDGVYALTLTDAKGISDYNYSIYDSENDIDSSYRVYPNEKNIMTLYGGDQYFIEVEQNEGIGSYTLKIDYPESAQQYLDNFSNGGENESKDSASGANPSEDIAEAADESISNEDLILQQLEELQSEMNELKNENEILKNILDENEIEYD